MLPLTMKQEVLKAMHDAGKPVKAGDLAKQMGVEKSIVDKAMAELKKEGAIESPKMCFWQPKA